MVRMFWAVVFSGLAAGSASAHPLALADYESDTQRERNATKAAKIAKKCKHKKRGINRCAYALEAMGRLRVYNEDVHAALDRSVRKGAVPEAVQTKGFWALGEVASALPWEDEHRALSALLLEGIARPLSMDAMYYASDALGKSYFQHAHTLEENLEVATGLNRSQAVQVHLLPSAFYVVQSKILSLDVVLELSNRALTKAASKDVDDLKELYQAELTLLTMLDTKRAPLVANFDAKRVAIGDAFANACSGYDHNFRPLSLFTSWYLPKFADVPEFSDLYVQRLAQQTERDQTPERLVSTWATGKVWSSEQARERLRERSRTEQDAQVMRCLFRGGANTFDPLQLAFGIEVSEQGQ